MTLRERKGKALIIKTSNSPPPFTPPKRTKGGRKTIASKSQNLFKGEVSYLKEQQFADARERFLTLEKLNFRYERDGEIFEEVAREMLAIFTPNFGKSVQYGLEDDVLSLILMSLEIIMELMGRNPCRNT